MKKTAFISSTLFGNLTLLGILFKVMHWPGAGIILVTGIAGLALIGLPSAAIHRYQKT